MKTGYKIIGAFIGALLLVVSMAQAQDPGQDFFTKSVCATCHGDRGEGNVGPNLQGTKMTLDAFKSKVRVGSETMPPTPADKLSDADIERLYKYVASAKAAAPTAPPDPGLEIYAHSVCSTCHGKRGEGDFAKSILGTKLTFDRFQAMARKGSEVMPPTAPSQLSDADLQAIYKYLVNPSSAFITKPMPPMVSATDPYSSSPCSGCHGPNATGGICPPLVSTSLTFEEFQAIVRHGKGIMSSFSVKVVPDQQLQGIYNFVKAQKLPPGKMPLVAQIGGILSGENVVRGFSVVLGLSILLGLRTLVFWFRLAGYGQIFRFFAKLGFGRFLAILIGTIVAEGLLSASLWGRNKARWFVHALTFYGFAVLFVADILLPVYSPEGHVISAHSGNIVGTIGGVCMIVGILYWKYRYRTHVEIDNGLTRGRDLLFVNLMLLMAITGFLTKWFASSGATEWILISYVLHLFVIGFLLLSAPFSRFAHALVVPILVAASKMAEVQIANGADMTFADLGPVEAYGEPMSGQGLWKPLATKSVGTVRADAVTP